MNLCLGTVQFGMDYGICGGKKPTNSEIIKTLDYARASNITALDTAAGYGDAQLLLGQYMINHPGSFELISKLSMNLFKNCYSFKDYLEAAYRDTETTLGHLFIPYLKGLLFHNPAYLYNKNAVSALRQLKESGYTEWIGVSVYEPKDALYALELGMDIIEVPSNLFDHRFDEISSKAGPFAKIFARSIFLQGLLLMDIEEAKAKFPSAVEYLMKFDSLSQSLGYSRRELAFACVKQKKGISAIIFGVDHIGQLKENIDAFQAEVPKEIIDEIAAQFDHVSEDIISPLKWK